MLFKVFRLFPILKFNYIVNLLSPFDVVSFIAGVADELIMENFAGYLSKTHRLRVFNIS